MTESLTLDDDQARVAHAGASERLVVEAGPGSGKTETVSARIEHLVEEGLWGTDVLVISFSRAAVEAVQRRQRNRGTHVTGWVTTLDSLATRLIVEAGVDPEGMGFDRRIERLRKLIESGDSDAPLADVGHVIIDEAQDIVGERADLVMTLLGKLPEHVGFTILGDPLQGIYDFQLAAGAVVERTLAEMGLELGATAVRLSGQYRAITRDATKAMALRGIETGPSPWRATMLEWLASAPQLHDVEDFTDSITRESGTVAILTDTNAAALTVLKILSAAGVTAELLPRSVDRALAPWLAEVLGDVTGSLSRDDFLELAGARLPIEAEEAWALMRRVTQAKTKFMDVKELTRRLSVGMAPIALGSPRRDVVVSTVHRAKGLEFDNVYLLHPDDWNSEDAWALARQMYVALTRPRLSLFTFRRSGSMKRWWKDKRSDRIIRSKGYGTTGFEVRGIDWRAAVPPNHDDDPVRTQEVLLEAAGRAPLPVTVDLDPYRSTLANPVYEATLEGTPIGILNSEFITAFRKRIGGKNGWPELLELHLVGVETVAALPQTGPVGKNGLWLSPQIVGPATLRWSKE